MGDLGAPQEPGALGELGVLGELGALGEHPPRQSVARCLTGMGEWESGCWRASRCALGRAGQGRVIGPDVEEAGPDVEGLGHLHLLYKSSAR